MDAEYDVVVVGAGFAGLTAARELAQRHCSVVVLEGRDRIGGRTWTDNRLGHRLEMGGTWVHWYQPHVWAEITRYGFELFESPTPINAYWMTDGKVQQGRAEEWMELADAPLTRAFERAREYFPHPYKPFDPSLVEGGFRDVSTDEYIRGLGLDPGQEELVRVFWNLYNHAPNNEASHTWFLHIMSTYGITWPQMMEVTAYYKLREGTGALAAAIAAEVPEIQLDMTVAGVEQRPDQVIVTTKAGDQVRAQAVIVTAPRNALRDIRFSPALSEVKTRIIAEGQASKGLKLWARLSGTYEPFFAYGDEHSPLGFASVEYHVDGDTIIVGFGADSQRLDGNNPAAVRSELTRWLPDVEVVGVASHDWVADPFSQQTWLTPRPGQFAAIEEMQRPDGRIHLAGGDYVRGGPSSIDGAIEGGLISARRAVAQLEGEPAVAGAV